MEQKIITLSFSLLNQVKLFHWATKSYAAHKALGDLHDVLSDLTDNLVECYIGSAGRQPLSLFEVTTSSHTDLKQVVPFIKDYTSIIRKMRGEIKASELQNIVDEIISSLDKTLYLLNLN